MKRFAFVALLVASNAFADSTTIRHEGIESKLTGLDGSLQGGTAVNIGMAERYRSGKWDYDNESNSVPNTIPYAVYLQGQTSLPNNDVFWHPDEGSHATEVAQVMIGSAEYDPAFEGVAPKARLHSVAFQDILDDGLSAVALQSLARRNVVPEIRAINLSYSIVWTKFEQNGKSILTQYIDWAAQHEDVLYVVGGLNQDSIWPRGKPQDNFNGMTVGSSDYDSDQGYFAKFGTINHPVDFANDERSYIDIIAPGGSNIGLLGHNAMGEPAPIVRNGGSLAAAHVTGTVALMEQYKDQQSRALNPRFFLTIKHTVYKAILMNSADKIEGVQGSRRTIFNDLGQDWLHTAAYEQSETPLDKSIGTGHLNARRAIQQLGPGWWQSTGELSPDRVPRIGWDQANIGLGDTQVYKIGGTIAGGSWASITLCWDRILQHTGGSTFNSFDMFLPYADPYDVMADLDLYLLDANDNTIIDSSDSVLQNTEHIFFQIPLSGEYKIVVHHAGGHGATTGYGLAWWIGNYPSFPGDFDGDGAVGPDDYDAWRANFGGAEGTGGNGDGTVDTADYVMWRNNLSAGSGSLAAVPEPSAAGLISLSVLLFLNQSGSPRGHKS
jgi:hypothetical protein